MKMAVFWVVGPCRLVHHGDRPEDGGSKDL
jgi:hypothetical protein